MLPYSGRNSPCLLGSVLCQKTRSLAPSLSAHLFIKIWLALCQPERLPSLRAWQQGDSQLCVCAILCSEEQGLHLVRPPRPSASISDRGEPGLSSLTAVFTDVRGAVLMVLK